MIHSKPSIYMIHIIVLNILKDNEIDLSGSEVPHGCKMIFGYLWTSNGIRIVYIHNCINYFTKCCWNSYQTQLLS